MILLSTVAAVLAIAPSPADARVRHVAWIVFENHGHDRIFSTGSSAPTLRGLARRYGIASRMHGLTHPSLPNYLAMTSGSTSGVADDGPPAAHPLPGPSLFGQLRGSWRSLQDGMPAPCLRRDAGDYVVRHNPAAYYLDVRAECASRSVALPAPGRPLSFPAKFTFITPSRCHSMHANSCAGSEDPVAQGDRWLAALWPRIRASAQWRAGALAVFVTFDEDGEPFTAANRIGTVVLHPSVRGVIRRRAFTHCHLLRAAEDLLGAAPLGCAAGAPGLAGAFGLR